MEMLADLNASGSNLAPHMHIRTANKCVSMHLYAFLVHQICAAGDIAHQNWKSFNCSMNVAKETLVYTVTLSTETKRMRSKHIYIQICIQHSSMLVRAETSDTTWKLPVLQRWKFPAPFGPEQPSTHRHNTKDTVINTLPAAPLMQALAEYLWRLTYGKKERQKIGQRQPKYLSASILLRHVVT